MTFKDHSMFLVQYVCLYTACTALMKQLVKINSYRLCDLKYLKLREISDDLKTSVRYISLWKK